MKAHTNRTTRKAFFFTVALMLTRMARKNLIMLVGMIVLIGLFTLPNIVSAGGYTSSALQGITYTTGPYANTTNNSIAAVSVTAGSGSGSSSITSISFTLNNTSNADVTRAVAYFTTTSTFSTATQFGTAINNPTGTITFTGSTATFSNTTVYVWLAVDIASSATSCDTLGASVPANGLTIGGTNSGTKTPTNNSTPTSVTIKPANSYCIASASTVYSITRVQFAGIDNSSTSIAGGSSPGYEEYTCVSGNVVAGSSTNSISVTATGAAGNNFFVDVFIDWNQNGVFTDSGEEYQLGSYSTASGVKTGNISVPANAAAGTTRMRVYNIFSANPATPCSNPSNGQVEDYLINVSTTPCATPSAQPTSLVLNPAGDSVSGSFTAASPAPDGYLIVRTTSASAPTNPVDGTTYAAGSSALGGVIVASNSGTSFTATSLTSSTQYWFWVYSMNSLCSGGPKYLTSSPLSGNTTTTALTPVTRNWIGAGAGGSGTDFNDGANWSPTGTPTSVDTCRIIATSAATITLSTDITIGSLVMDESAGSSVLRLDATNKTLTVNGTTSLNASAGNTNTQTQVSVGNASGSAGAMIFKGNVTVADNSAADVFFRGFAGSSGQFIFEGDLTLSGIHAVTSGTNFPDKYIFRGTNQTYTNNGATAFNMTKVDVGDGTNATTLTLAGTSNANIVAGTNGADLTVKAGSTLDLTTHTLNRSASGGTFQMDAGSTLKLAASTGGQTGSNFPLNFATMTLNATSTVEYNAAGGTNQTVFGTPTYGNLTLTNSSGTGSTTKTAGAALTVAGNLTINSLATFAAGTSLTHNVGGNWTNNGTFSFTTGSIINFNTAGSKTISGSSTTGFNSITVNKGTDTTNILEATGPMTMSGNLTLTNGVLKLTHASAVAQFNAGPTIPSTAGVWVNGGMLNSGGFSYTNNGLIRITSGTATFGTGTGNSITNQTGSTFDVQGGTVNVGGRLQHTGGTFSMSGGQITVCTAGNTSATVACFDMSATTNMTVSNGTVIFQNAASSTGGDLKTVSGAGTKSITGGTFQFGNASTPASQVFKVTSGATLFNIVVNGTNSPTAQITGLTTFAGSASSVASGGTLALAAISTNNGTLTVNGTFRIDAGGSINGTAPVYSSTALLKYNTGTSIVRGLEWSATSGAGYPNDVQISNNTNFDLGGAGSADRQIAGSLTIDSGSTLTMSTMSNSLAILKNLTINGTLALGTNSGGNLRVAGNWTNNGTFTHNNRTVSFNGASAQAIGGSAASNNFFDVIFNNSSGMTLTKNVNVSDNADFSLGKVDGVTNNITLAVTNTGVGAVSSSGGGYLDGKLQRALPSIPLPTTATDYVFPVGTTNGYSPVTLGLTSNTNLSSTFTVSAVNSYMTGVNDTTQAINRTWTLTSSAADNTIIADLSLRWVTGATPAGDESANVNVSTLNAFRRNGDGSINELAADNRTSNTVTVNNVGQFSEWTLVNGGGVNATLVKLMSFNAINDSGQVQIQWTSGYEVNNLGYNLYRETGSSGSGKSAKPKLERVTPSLIAGSALLAGNRTVLTAGQSYTWYDTAPKSGQVRYWLEDVDTSGKRTMNGPITATIGKFSRSMSKQAKLLSQLNAGSNQVTIKGGPTQGGNNGLPSRDSASLARQQQVEAMPGVKLRVRKDGWYRVTQAELVAAGLDPNVNASMLKLYCNSVEIPIRVSGDGQQLTATDTVEFYGRAINSATADARTYYLVVGTTPGSRITPAQASAPQAAAAAPDSFDYTLERTERVTFFTGLDNGDNDSFFGQVITTTPVSQTLAVNNLKSGAGSEAQMTVSLQGVTSGQHQVKVLFNGVEVGTMSFSDKKSQTQVFALSNATLAEGNNTVQLVALGGDSDVSLVDKVRLNYAHAYRADNNALLLSASSDSTVSVMGFTNANIRVVDVTSAQGMQELIPTIELQPDGTYAASLQVEMTRNGSAHSLYFFTNEQAVAADAVVKNEASSWAQNAGADFVIITGRDFVQSIQPLVDLRRSQGLSVNVVDVEDIYDEFSYGEHSPQAVRDFLASAMSTWTTKPRYVMLVGDATYDPKNYLGQGANDLVPTKLLYAGTMKTASDDWFADFNNDGVPELAVGRLPVRTASEAGLMVNKIVSYTPGQSTGALLVADKNDSNDFEGSSQSVKELLPVDVQAQVINRGNQSAGSVRTQIINGINQGPLVVNYFGHGSVGLWSGAGLLGADDAGTLANSPRLPMLTAMTCLNGFFHDINGESMAEAFLKSQTGGAIAVWASSGLTNMAPQAEADRQLYQSLFGGSSITIGDAVRGAKAATTDTDVRRTWILFGDPTMRLR